MQSLILIQRRGRSGQ